MLSGASMTTLHKVFPVQCCPRRYSWGNIAQIKTMCSSVQDAPNNIVQEKKSCAMLSLYCRDNITLAKTLCNVVLEASDNTEQK